MARTRALVAGAALLVVLTGCGASDDDKAAQAVSAGLMKEQDEPFSVTQEQADCVGDGFVAELGVDKLKKYGLLTDDLESSDKPLATELSQDDAEGAAGVMVDCTEATKLLKELMLAGQDIGAEAEACIDKALTDDALEKFFTATFARDQAAVVEALGPLDECVAE